MMAPTVDDQCRPVRSLPGLWLTGCFALLLAVLGSACQSTSGGAKQFASVQIAAYSPEIIHATVDQIFTKAGYKNSSSGGDWFYDRRASTMSQVLYGGWFDQEGVVERVKLHLLTRAEGGYELTCRPVMVRDSNDPFFAEESSMTRLKSRPYDKLLKKVADRLAEDYLPPPTLAPVE